MTELSEELSYGDEQEPPLTMEEAAEGEQSGGPWYEGAALDDGEARWLGSKGYGSLGELVQAYRALERYQGKSVALPASGASEEDWRRLYGRLGCPAAPDDYRFDDIAANGPDDEAGLAWYRETAHRLGLSQRQAGELLGAFVVRNDQLAGASVVTAPDGRQIPASVGNPDYAEFLALQREGKATLVEWQPVPAVPDPAQNELARTVDALVAAIRAGGSPSARSALEAALPPGRHRESAR